MKMKKLLAFALALSCMAVSPLTVSAASYTADDWTPNYLVKDGQIYSNLEYGCCDYYLFETDGTDLSSETSDAVQVAFNISDFGFNSIVNDFNVENPENTYFVESSNLFTEEDARNYVAEHPCIKKTSLMQVKEYTPLLRPMLIRFEFPESYGFTVDNLTEFIPELSVFDSFGDDRLYVENSLLNPEEGTFYREGIFTLSTCPEKNPFHKNDNLHLGTLDSTPEEAIAFATDLETQLKEKYPDLNPSICYSFGDQDGISEVFIEPLDLEMTPATYLAPADATAPASFGDLTDDGNINIMDVILLNKAIYGKSELTEAQAAAADVNQDGKPDAADSLLIMKHILKLIDSFQ